MMALGVGCGEPASLRIELRAFAVMTCVSGFLQLATTMARAAPPRPGRPAQRVERPDWTMRWASFHIFSAFGIAAMVILERVSAAAAAQGRKGVVGVGAVGIDGTAGMSPFVPRWCYGGTPELAAVAALHAMGSCLLLLGRDVRRRRERGMKEE